VIKTLSTLNRRSFLKRTAAGAGALAAPALISSKALASSGEVNFIGWAGYPSLAEKVFPAFEAATGIKVNFKELPDQDTMFAEAKVALEAGGVDLLEPTIDRWGGWNSNGLLGAFDESKLAMDNYLPGLADGSAGERSRADGQLYYVPSNWGTEALVVNSADAKLSSPASLGDLFNADNSAVLRPHSTLAAMGRWLDATGQLPRPWMDGYTDMAAMVELLRPRATSFSGGRARMRPTLALPRTAPLSACAGTRPAITCAMMVMPMSRRSKVRSLGTRASS
jgi:spermidine/putrescine transport system substrate-binding protein